MKKKISIFVAFIITVMCFVPTLSFADTYFVSDNDGLLDDAEITILETRCSWLSEGGIELAIAVDATEGVQAADEVDAFADNMLAGSGVVVCINDATKTLAVKAYGDAANTFTEDMCASVQTIAQQQYSNVGIYEACQSAVVNSEYVLSGYDLVESGFYMPSMLDEVGYLTDDEVQQVTNRLDGIRTTYNFDVAVVVTETLTADTAEASADDIYDYNFFGAGEDDNGILLYVSKNPREYHISTHGTGIEFFSDDAIAALQDNIVSYLSDDDYYGAFMAYADTVEEVLSGSFSSGGSGSEDFSLSDSITVGVVVGFVIALVISLISTGTKKRKMNNAVTASYANEYMKKGSFNLKRSRDLYLYSNVVRREKPKENNNSGSSHTSSSGRSHGGGGGSY